MLSCRVRRNTVRLLFAAPEETSAALPRFNLQVEISEYLRALGRRRRRQKTFPIEQMGRRTLPCAFALAPIAMELGCLARNSFSSSTGALEQTIPVEGLFLRPDGETGILTHRRIDQGPVR